MYLVRIEGSFSAAHSLLIGGEREPVHGHDWDVEVTLSGRALDADGLLVDFHAAERSLRRVLEPFRNRNLNDVPPFDRTNPSAELVARHVADRMAEGLPAGVGVHSVSVGEAPGCTATFLPAAGAA